MKVSVVSETLKSRWLRHFPTQELRWGEISFDFSDNFEDADAVVVYDSIPASLSGKVFARRSLFIASEPPSIKTYRPGFLLQFDRVLTTDQSVRHPSVVLGQVAIPWHVGVRDGLGNFLENPMSFKELEKYEQRKTKSVSIVSSSKANTIGHAARAGFSEKIKKYFGDEVDFFGRNIVDFGDKIEVLGAYRYHIAIENSAYQHYWTEKFSDPLLCLSYPIYYGCPNLRQYFEARCFTEIDIFNVDGAIETIKKLLDSDVAEKSLDCQVMAKRRILYEYNVIPTISRIAKRLYSEIPARNMTLFSEEGFRGRKKIFKSLRRFKAKSSLRIK